MIEGLIEIMKAAEAKLSSALDEIRKTMKDGTTEERLAAVRVHFDNCDEGNKEYLTPEEFRKLSSTLGVDMSDAELREAIEMIDEDGNGQIEVDEYLMWWGDDDLLELYNELNPGSDEGDDDDNGEAEGKPSEEGNESNAPATET
eukprot:g5606.t1